jgi:hypothetical protein
MTDTYLYARVGRGDRIGVLRLPLDGDDMPLPGGDQPTTPAVGSLVLHRVELDDSGAPVLIAHDATPTQGDVQQALAEGWQHPPAGDRWAALLLEGEPV